MKMLRAVFYLRVATARPKEEIAALREILQQRGWTVVVEHVDVSRPEPVKTAPCEVGP